MIRTLVRFFSKRAAKTTYTLTDDRLASFLAGPSMSTALSQSVTPETALTLSDYYAAIRNISEDVAKLPFKVYRQLEPRGKETVRKHPVYKLLQVSPNPEMAPLNFRETVTHWAIGWGNGYAEIERNNAGTPMALWPIHPNRVRLIRSGGQLFGEIKLDSGSTAMLPYGDLLHIKGLGNGYLGYSVVRLAAESIGHGQALERFGASFFGNGAAIGTVFSYPHALSPTAKKDFQEMIAEQREGLANAHKSLILENGGKVERTSVPPEEAQFIESRQLSVEVMCRWLRIPPHKVQHLLRATFSNIEAQATEYVVDTLMPWLVRWEQEVNRKLISPNAVNIFAEHSVNALLRGESAARAQFYSQMTQIGAMTANEIRDLEGMNPTEGGDVAMVQGALIPLTEAQKPKQEPLPPPPAADEPPPDDEGASRADQIAGVSGAYVRLINDALGRCHKLAVSKRDKGETGYVCDEKARALLCPLIESLADSIAAVRGVPPLVAVKTGPIIEAVVSHYLECGRRLEHMGGSLETSSAWLPEEAERIAGIAAGAIWNALDAETN